jgi:ATP-binding cassette subfamily F protein 3
MIKAPRPCYDRRMLQIKEVTLRVGGRPLLERASVSINRAERVGLVGRNGTGKSTLLRAIAGETAVDEGEIALPQRWSVGRLAQEAPSGPERLLDCVLAADRERSALIARADQEADPHAIAELHTRLADINAHAAPARAAQILAGLGFDESAQQRPVSDFSGGWRMRVALAALLFSAPDLLLLDEPSNHLDLEATIWLESFLKGYPGTLLIVSHDRNLLNAVAQRIVHLEKRRLTLYSGNYDRFERTRRERQARQSAINAKLMAQRRHIQAFVDRFRYKASKARQAQSRLKWLARMEPIVGLVEDQSIAFDFPKPEPLSPPLIATEQVCVGYQANRPVLRGLDLRIDMDDRIALLGANGNGKSTFMRLLAGTLRPQEGRLTRPPKLKVGYFAQDQAESLDLGASPLEHMARCMPLATETKLRAHLGRFGFSQDKAEVKVGRLSGGEKARLLFALMSREAPQVLLLDEPTNHLDLDAREALVQALNDYEGAIVLVTHDPHLIELIADRLWLVADGTVQPFEGDLSDYRRLLLEPAREAAEDDTGKAESHKRNRRRAAAENRAQLAPLRQAVAEAEKRLDTLLKGRAALERKLAEPNLYQGSAESLADLQRQHADLCAAITRTEEVWLEAQSRLEAAATANG